MDLGQLRYFHKIVEHRSFTRAAQDCLVSQPALSQQISKLERELGQPLFERHGRSIRLTPAGQILQGQADKILQLVDDAKRRITDDGQTGLLSLSAIPTIAPFLLPSIVKDVASQFPKATLKFHEDTTTELVKRCADGEVDIGLLALPVTAKHLTFETLFTEELLLALPINHPLVSKPKISIKDITEEAFVLLSSSHCLLETIETFCTSRNFKPIASSKIEQLETVKNLVAIGCGLSFIPRMATRDNHAGIVYRSLCGERPVRKIAVCYNPHRFQSQLVTHFIKALHELFGFRHDHDHVPPAEKAPDHDSVRTGAF